MERLEVRHYSLFEPTIPSDTPVFDTEGKPIGSMGILTDITERKRAEEELQLLQTMTQAISEAPDFQSALYVALSKVCQATSWDFGEAWIKSADGTVLECSTTWCSSKSAKKDEVGSKKDEFTSAEEGEPTDSFHPLSFTLQTSLSEFRRQSQAFTFAPNNGLPGQVWSSRQPVWIKDVSVEPESFFARSHLAKACGLRSGFGVPILADDQVLAVLAFFMFESHQEDRRLVELISAVAAQLGAVIQQKQAEAALQESQRRLASLIDALPGIVFSCASDPEWSMTYLSEGCLTLTGYKSEELIGNRAVSFDSITHEEDLPTVLAALKTGVAQKQPYVVEYRIRTKSGQEKWVWEKGHGVFDSTGSVLGIEGFITDITDRKRMEEALRSSESELRALFEAMTDVIFVFDSHGRCLKIAPHTNPELLCKPAAEMLGKTLHPGSASPDKARPIIASVGLEKRDYQTLAEATSDLDLDVKIAGFSKDAIALARAFPKVMPDNMSNRFYEWAELVQLYRDADLVVVSVLDNKYTAGITTLLEAMACRRLVKA